jgi:hypothetical protein
MCHAVLCCGLEKLLSKGHGQSMAGVRHGHGMVCVNETQSPHVNQTGKAQSKPLVTWHGTGMAGALHGHSMVCVK